MTAEERFERIESDLAAAAATLGRLTESQTSLAESHLALIRATHESHQRLTDSMIDFVQRIDRYVDSADARMRRIEENLDGLIRAITAEHSNGKGKQ